MSSLDISNEEVPATEVAKEANITVNVEDVPEESEVAASETVEPEVAASETVEPEVKSSDNDLENRVVELEKELKKLKDFLCSIYIELH